MDELMTVEEVAASTRVPAATLRWMRHVGDRGPRSFRIGRRVYYKRSDVADWLESQYEATKLGA